MKTFEIRHYRNKKYLGSWHMESESEEEEQKAKTDKIIKIFSKGKGDLFVVNLLQDTNFNILKTN